MIRINFVDAGNDADVWQCDLPAVPRIGEEVDINGRYWRVVAICWKVSLAPSVNVGLIRLEP